MKDRFSRRNQPITCTCCGKRTLPSQSEYIDSQLCRVCYDSAGDDNGHMDGHHKGVDCKDYCPQANNVDCMHEVAEMMA